MYIYFLLLSPRTLGQLILTFKQIQEVEDALDGDSRQACRFRSGDFID